MPKESERAESKSSKRISGTRRRSSQLLSGLLPSSLVLRRRTITKRKSKRRRPSPTENDPVKLKPYFYGIMPREDVEMILSGDGDFVVRRTTFRPDKHCTGLCVSVKWKNCVHHVVVRFKLSQNKFSFMFEDKAFPTVVELVDYYVKMKQPLTGRNPVKLNACHKRADWVLRDSQVTLKSVIGKGNFGEVWQAELVRDDTNVVENVAVKFLKSDGVPTEERLQFFAECRRLRQLRHDQLVSFIGITVDGNPAKMVMELCDIPLTKYLEKKRGTISWLEKSKMLLQIAKGMEYLAKEGIIHRDLAARNCLLKDGVVKIADLGMAREGGLYKMTPGLKPIPIKWTAPDAMRLRDYSEKTDVWSFGVLTWEVLTDGEAPYAALQEKSKAFGADLIEFLDAGNRLEAPKDTPAELKKLMLSCMDGTRANRPTFSEIVKALEDIYKAMGGVP
uniref:Tyrosine-protein kinase n=1 Tax=Trichuris muris TaxID=70415 RepID=A0A5S6QQH2_TRIMR